MSFGGYSQSVVRLNDTTFYLLTESQAREVVFMESELRGTELRNALLSQMVEVRDSIISEMTRNRAATDAIDSALVEVVDLRGERIELSRKEVARLKRQRTWAAIKGAWREITVGVGAAALGYGVGYLTSR